MLKSEVNVMLMGGGAVLKNKIEIVKNVKDDVLAGEG